MHSACTLLTEQTTGGKWPQCRSRNDAEVNLLMLETLLPFSLSRSTRSSFFAFKVSQGSLDGLPGNLLGLLTRARYLVYQLRVCQYSSY